MSKFVSVDGTNPVYINEKGIIKNEYLVTIKPEADKKGRYVMAGGQKKYVDDLLEEHFGKTHPSAGSGSGKDLSQRRRGAKEVKKEKSDIPVKSKEEYLLEEVISNNDNKLTYAQIIEKCNAEGFNVSRDAIAAAKRSLGLIK